MNKEIPEPPDGSIVVMEYANGVKIAFWRKDGADPRGSQIGQWFEADMACKWSDPLAWEAVLGGEMNSNRAVYRVSPKPYASLGGGDER